MKAVVVMLSINLALAGVNILLKEILNEGISQLLIVVYRQTISSLFLLPIAYFWERKTRPQLTAYTLFLLFISSLLGLTLTLYLFLIGLHFTSATFSCAFLNLVPVNTFFLAVLFRMEKVNMKSKGGIAKVVGTLVCISGNLLLILYKGTPLTSPGSTNGKTNGGRAMVEAETQGKWLIGSLVLTGGAIQSAVLHLIIDRKNSLFIVKGKFAILSLIYAGSVGSGLCYVGMSWCVKQKGPVFTAAFTPFMEIFAAIFDFFILHEPIHLGS
ncbi:WAT1-related protein [Cucumis melo var. makuwa]|uniref:WAT1-related protein n=1 Tax=Cucumis melo var. makuwa TaxID=1194695 RepID=A0A5D3BD10_CUCMM|nr:WAT1-related protein [Cucumis melo var. makuwa]